MRSWWKKEKCLRASDRLLKAGKVDDALACVDEIWRAAPHADLAVQKAWVLKEGARYAEALSFLDEVLRDDAGHPVFWLLRGECELALKNFAGAVADLQRALELGGENLHADYLLGRAYLGLGQFESAARHFEPIVKYDKDLVQARLLAMSELYLMERSRA